jgi:dihydroorotase
MSKYTLIKQATIVNEGKQFVSDVLIKDERIEKIAPNISCDFAHEEINAEGLYLIPGVIDDQVHFREPGLTHKANIHTESRAAVAGGTTSFMEMPNTNPPTTTQERLEEKFAIASQHALANHSFFMGVANNNIEEVLATNKKKHDVCGIKIFMGSSTGDMLVDNEHTLNTIFANTELLIATHCEDEQIIKANKLKYAHADNASFHPIIRNEEACYASSSLAIALAKKHNTRLHILHISTAKELALFTNTIPLGEKKITNEVCVHHLHFTAEDYTKLGNLIQCNPAIKAPEHKAALWQGLLNDTLDIIATDHAPHTWEEKQLPYGQAPSGLPLVQHSLQMMLSYVQKGTISIEKVVEKMSHAPAICFQIRERGFIREGYFADLVLINSHQNYTVNKSNILYKCAWSPLEGETLPMSITTTFVSGHKAFDNGKINDAVMGKRLHFR